MLDDIEVFFQTIWELLVLIPFGWAHTFDRLNLMIRNVTGHRNPTIARREVSTSTLNGKPGRLLMLFVHIVHLYRPHVLMGTS